MMKLPPNTNKIETDVVHICDVCRKNNAKYYNLTWYIHICSVECFEIFIKNYNKEIDAFVIVKLDPIQKEDNDAM